jgi:hypothetical protein
VTVEKPAAIARLSEGVVTCAPVSAPKGVRREEHRPQGLWQYAKMIRKRVSYCAPTVSFEPNFAAILRELTQLKGLLRFISECPAAFKITCLAMPCWQFRRFNIVDRHIPVAI